MYPTSMASPRNASSTTMDSTVVIRTKPRRDPTLLLNGNSGTSMKSGTSESAKYFLLSTRDPSACADETSEMTPTLNSPVVWKPLVLCPNPELARRMRGALAEIGIAEGERPSGYPGPGELPAAVRQTCNIA